MTCKIKYKENGEHGQNMLKRDKLLYLKEDNGSLSS
jgi:hypothetical protein